MVVHRQAVTVLNDTGGMGARRIGHATITHSVHMSLFRCFMDKQLISFISSVRLNQLAHKDLITLFCQRQRRNYLNPGAGHGAAQRAFGRCRPTSELARPTKVAIIYGVSCACACEVTKTSFFTVFRSLGRSQFFVGESKKLWFLRGFWFRGGVREGKIGILEVFQQRWSHISPT